MSTSSHSSGDARSRYAAASPALPVPPQARRVIEVLKRMDEPNSALTGQILTGQDPF